MSCACMHAGGVPQRNEIVVGAVFRSPDGFQNNSVAPMSSFRIIIKYSQHTLPPSTSDAELDAVMLMLVRRFQIVDQS